MRFVVCVAALLVGAATLLLELALTRLYGFLDSPARAFVTLALSFFGAATGALITHRVGWHPRRRPGIAAAGAAAGSAFAALATSAAGYGLFTAFVLGDWVLLWLAWVGLGTALAALYQMAPRMAGFVAAAQLLGAGLAAVAFPALLAALTPPGSAFLSSLLLALAALVIGGTGLVAGRSDRDATIAVDDDLEEGRGWKRVLAGVATGLLGLVGALALPAHLLGGWAPADPEQIAAPKPLFNSVGVGEESETIVFSRWSSAGRTDVTESPRAPDARWVYQDGAFVGLMHRTSGAGSTGGGGVGAQALRADIGNLPFLLPGAKDRVLVIGAGGGQQVLMALAGGAREVVVAEPTAAQLEAARSLADYNGGVFDRPQVRVVPLDARAFLRASGEQFDVIVLTLASAGPAQPGGAMAGSHLFTQQAFGDYMDALRQDGRLVVELRDEEELLRAFSTAFQTWTSRGAAPREAVRRLIALNNQPAAQQSGGEARIVLPLLTVRKTPYLEDEMRDLAQVLSQTPFLPLFLPHLEQQSLQLYPALAAMALQDVGPAGVQAQAPYDIRPATDARPFFYEASKGLPWFFLLTPLVLAAIVGGVAWLCRRPVWDAADGGGVAEAEAAAFLEQALPWRFLGFAAAIGGGWGFTLLPLLHRIPPLWGQPALSGPVVYGALFLGAAAGSLLAMLRPGALRPTIGWACLAGGALGVALLELLPLVAGGLVGHGTEVRVAVAVALLAPLGLCLGVPLPAALRVLASAGHGSWAALLVAVHLLAMAVAQVYAYGLGLAWSLTVPAVLGGVCLFAAFMMAGLRALTIDIDENAATSTAGDGTQTADHTPFQRPATVV